jgi:arylsulfatase A-like enzyme
VDVLPTLFDLSGIAGGGEMDGRSLAPLMSADAGARPAGTEQTISFLLRKPVRQYPHTAPGDLVALRTPTAKYVWSSTGQHQYFDLAADPKETHNLYGASASVADLAAQVEAWRRSAGLDQPEGKLDRLTEDRLRSLGYIH